MQTASIISKFVCGFCSLEEQNCSAKRAVVTTAHVSIKPRSVLLRAHSMKSSLPSVSLDAIPSLREPLCAAAQSSSNVMTFSDGITNAPSDSSNHWRSPGSQMDGLLGFWMKRVPLPAPADALPDPNPASLIQTRSEKDGEHCQCRLAPLTGCSRRKASARSRWSSPVTTGPLGNGELAAAQPAV